MTIHDEYRAKHTKSAALWERVAPVDSRRHHPRHPPSGSVPDLRRARAPARASGTSTATSTSTTGWGTARSSSVTAIRRSFARCKSRWRAARTWAPVTSSRCAGPSWSRELVPVRRAGALHHVGHRGDAPRDARGAGVHGALADREVHGPLPRLARRRGRRRQSAVRRADVRRRARLDARPGDDLPAERHQGGAGGARARRHRGGHPRAGRRAVRNDADDPGLSARAARADDASRRGADLRRGDHRLPLLARRRSGVLRRHARSHHARQDRVGRPARRRALRTPPADVAPRVPRRSGLGPEPARARTPARSTRTRSAPPPPSPRSSCARTPRSRRARTRRGRSSGAVSRRR